MSEQHWLRKFAALQRQGRTVILPSADSFEAVADELQSLQSKLDALTTCGDCGTVWRSEHDVSKYDCPHCGIMDVIEQRDFTMRGFQQVQSRLDDVANKLRAALELLTLAYHWEKGRYLPNGNEENEWLDRARALLVGFPGDPRDALKAGVVERHKFIGGLGNRCQVCGEGEHP